MLSNRNLDFSSLNFLSAIVFVYVLFNCSAEMLRSIAARKGKILSYQAKPVMKLADSTVLIDI